MRRKTPRSPRQNYLWHEWVTRVEFVILNSALVASLLLVLVQVVSRGLVGHPLSWTDEASRLALIWLTFVGAGYLMSRGKHLAVDSFSALFPVRVRTTIEIASNLVVAVACVAILIAGVGFVRTVAESVSTALSASMFWFYGAALVGGLLVAMHAVVNSIRAIRDRAPIYPGISEEAADQQLDHAVATNSAHGAASTNKSNEGPS